MKRKIGILCMTLGIVLLLGALGLFLYNQNEAENAGRAADKVLAEIRENVIVRTTKNELPQSEPPAQNVVETEPIAEMTEVEIDGYAYIGYVSIPALDLELPVMSDWDYTRLKIAPCRQFGSTKSDDLVIAAHNYKQHFGRIKELNIGDLLSFTDMNGEVFTYLVQNMDILQPTDVEDVENSRYDLVLYTCTYDGKTRVVVGCNKK